MELKDIQFRIHGDNVVECEIALKIMEEATNASASIIDGPAFAPVYKIDSKDGRFFHVQFLPGYGRWQFDVVKYIADRGAPLREATDVIITKIVKKEGNFYEEPILAMEYCGALPAGNNAWQRSGRALSLAYAGIPYLYFAELGGVELDENRQIKAARFPNPIVPFAYLELGKNENTLALPIYKPSPSISIELKNKFRTCFGMDEVKKLVNYTLNGKDITGFRKLLEARALVVVKLLANERKRKDILTSEEFEQIYNHKNKQKTDWFVDKKMQWGKKTGIKNLTNSFNKLMHNLPKIAVATGSTDMPFCIIPKEKRANLKSLLEKIYKRRLDGNLVASIGDNKRNLAVVFVAGFKPRGDDSRPDRGLTPLVRMLLGRNGYDVLSVVYGPAPKSSLKLLSKDQDKLCNSNGLWESVIRLSDFLLVDTPTMAKTENVLYKTANLINKRQINLLASASLTPKIGEHDVDTVLHILFTEQDDKEVFESMCNPPGGDWSGISIINFKNKNEFRWTSLPRVSGQDMKRPDHLIQFNNKKILLAIESKEKSATLEKAIGPRLKKYIQQLISKQHTTFRVNVNSAWNNSDLTEFVHDFLILSCSAFVYDSEKDLLATLEKGKTEIAIAIEFNKQKTAIVHIAASKELKSFLSRLELNENIAKFMDLKYHFI